MRHLGAKEDRPGWVKAPPVIEAEIRAVWQEDELPDEITKAAGYRAFTLGGEAQDWVDSMAEVVDGGKAVYGRPKPAAPVQRRQLATPSPPLDSPPQAVPQPTSPPPVHQPPSPPRPRILMPDIDGAPPPPVPHVAMPEVDGAPSPSTPRVVMPDIEQSPPTPHPLMPDIDASPHPRPRTLPRRVLMPDVGEEQESSTRRHPPSMPEIG